MKGARCACGWCEKLYLRPMPVDLFESDILWRSPEVSGCLDHVLVLFIVCTCRIFVFLLFVTVAETTLYDDQPPKSRQADLGPSNCSDRLAIRNNRMSPLLSFRPRRGDCRPLPCVCFILSCAHSRQKSISTVSRRVACSRPCRTCSGSTSPSRRGTGCCRCTTTCLQ